MNVTEKRLAAQRAQRVLSAPNKTDDQKLAEVFEIYKKDLQQSNSQLYYALLGWMDAHKRELSTENPAAAAYFAQEV